MVSDVSSGVGDHATLPSKPIVSDMTVSSKESESKAGDAESRTDENATSQRDDGNTREKPAAANESRLSSSKGVSSSVSSSVAAEETSSSVSSKCKPSSLAVGAGAGAASSSSAGRYQYPTSGSAGPSQSNPGMHRGPSQQHHPQQQHHPTQPGPYGSMGRGGPHGYPGPPPTYYHGSSYGGPPPHNGHSHGHGPPPPPPHQYHPAHHHHQHHPAHHPPPHHSHAHVHMMAVYGSGQPPPHYMPNGAPPPPPRGGSYPPHPPPPPPPYGGPYSMPYGMPPSYHSMNPGIPHQAPTSSSNTCVMSDANSIGSKGSKSSFKKRTIDGIHSSRGPSSSSIPSAYSFRRTDSNSSSTSTVTAGNNTSGDTHITEESPHKRERSSADVPPLNMGGLSFDDADMGPPPTQHQSSNVQQQRHQHHPYGSSGSGHRHNHSSSHTGGQHSQQPLVSKPHKKYHRRDFSAASTASSLSVGGFSLGSYEGPRVGATEDPMMTDDPLLSSSPKRRKAGGEPLIIDTQMRPASVASHSVQSMGGDKSTRFEQLSLDVAKMPTSTSSASSAGQDRNLFLSLSTSPINNDVDATPISKNTAKQKNAENTEVRKKVASIFKPKGGVHPKIETAASEASRPSETPTPPVHGETGSSMADEHSLLNRHLRNQSFTPLPQSTANSPAAAAFASSIAPQLSWSIAGDTPSLGDLAEWEEDNKLNKSGDQKLRPSSASSADTRNMMISPHDFQFWKEEQEMAETGVSGTTTPLPVFFEQAGEGAENHVRYDHKKSNEQEHMQHMYGHGQGLKPSNKPMIHPGWSKHHDLSGEKHGMMPPTPMYASSDYRDDGYGPRSPMGSDRRDGGMDYYHPYNHHGGPHAHNDRIRHLRGRVPPGAHLPPMPLHIPPPMSGHLPMTSPMGLGPKAGLWSPHHHGGMPPLASPHHMGSPLGSMAQSKRKCVPLKPPIPSKFQGDIDKVKGAQVPEFTSLVNFPAHMSQKQSVNLPEGMRCCVMCGQACPCSAGNKNKKIKKQGSDGSLAPRSSNGQDSLGDKNSGYAIIPTQNKGLCTLCDVNVWVVVSSGLEIKWCKGCKNFRPWAAFGDKGLATKCLRCRERQREKYALQKEEKEKARVVSKLKK